MRLLSRLPGLLALVCQAVAAPVAFFIQTRRRNWLRLLMIITLMIPFYTSDALRAFSWSLLLSPSGALSVIIRNISFGEVSGGLRFTDASLYICLASSILPFGVLITAAALPAATDDIWKVSREFGVTSWAAFSRIALPASIPGICIGWMYMTAMAAFSSVEEQYVGDSVNMAEITSALINADLGDAIQRFSALSGMVAIALVTFMLVALFVVKYRHIATHFLKVPAAIMSRWYSRTPFGHRRAIRLVHKLVEDPFFVVVCAFVVLVYALVLIPVVQTVELSFSVEGEWGVTIEHYKNMLQSATLVAALNKSLLLALTVGLLCAVSVSAIVTVSWARVAAQIIVVVGISLGAVVPADGYALGLLGIVKLFGVESGGFWLVVVAHYAWAMPFCYGAMLIAARMIDQDLLLAAAESGLSATRIWRSVVTRLTRPAIVACAAFGFLLSLNDYRRGIYLGGGEEYLSTRVYGRLQSGIVEGGREIYACSGAVTVLSLVVILMMGLWFFRTYRDKMESNCG